LSENCTLLLIFAQVIRPVKSHKLEWFWYHDI